MRNPADRYLLVGRDAETRRLVGTEMATVRKAGGKP
jgi:hypothetical protein